MATKKTNIIDSENIVEVGKEQVLENVSNVDKDTMMLNILSALVDKVSALQSPQPTENSNVAKMNRYCTLVHLNSCADGLETTIRINGNIHMFKNFGEKRLYKYSDMENIVTRYRSLFERGVFTLGEDCQDLAIDFSIHNIVDVRQIAMFDSLIKKSEVEFEKAFSSFDVLKKRLYIKYFVINFYKNISEYNDSVKISIINRYSNNILRSLEQ